MPKTKYGPDDLLTDEQAAEVLNVKRASLVYWMYEKRIPVYRLGHRSVRFRYSDLQEFLKSALVPAINKQKEALREGVPA